LSALAACGDDDTSPTDAGSSGSGASGKGGSAGKGGTGGKSGSGGSAGKAGSSGSSAAVVCGTETCPKVNTTLTTLSPGVAVCCTDDKKCGAPNSSGVCLVNNAPGVPDTSCPTIHVTVMGSDYPQDGCCTPKGQCGGNFSAVGYGCVAREVADMGMGGPLESIACGDTDAGPPDAGN
jgi:hypothetical protein